MPFARNEQTLRMKRRFGQETPASAWTAIALAFWAALVLPDAARVRAAEAQAAALPSLAGLAETALRTAPAKELFGSAKLPAALPPQPYGFYSRGCAAGNVAMPLTGPYWQVMRPERNRYWGQPVLIDFLERFARMAHEKDGWPGLLIGDLSQPRGGPMTSGHASHQIGLDADIWLTPMPARVLTIDERNTMSAVLMTLDRRRINPQRFTERHARLIRRAALQPEVQRIFVHPPIKKYLCDFARRIGDRDRSWLAKVRPYYGHNYHFHIRLRCPQGARWCKDQGDPRPKDGTGCGAELAYWYSDRPWGGGRKKARPKFVNGIPLPRPRPHKRKPRPPVTLAALPKQCTKVLLAPAPASARQRASAHGHLSR